MINSRNLIYTNILDLPHFGDHIYVNFHLTMVDDGEIFVGSHTMFGPNVTLATAAHPILPELRENGYQYNLPIHIGKTAG